MQTLSTTPNVAKIAPNQDIITVLVGILLLQIVNFNIIILNSSPLSLDAFFLFLKNKILLPFYFRFKFQGTHACKNYDLRKTGSTKHLRDDFIFGFTISTVLQMLRTMMAVFARVFWILIIPFRVRASSQLLLIALKAVITLQ